MSLYMKKASRSQLGHLKISLCEDSGALVVTIFEARGLARKNGNPLDTYVKLYLLPDPDKTSKEKTKIIKDKDPRYNERFSFILLPEDYAKRLHISVWVHYNTARNELIGCMSFLVADLLGPNKGVNGWFQLLDKDEGRSSSVRVAAASPGESTLPPPFKNYAVTLVKSAAGYGFNISGPSPVFVTKVEEGLPASQADMQVGDLLVEVEGTDVTHASGEHIISIIKKFPEELHMILQRPAHQLKQRRQSTSSIPWPQSQSQTSINGPFGWTESSSQSALPPSHTRSFSDQPFVHAPLATGSALRDPPTWSRHTSMDKIVEEEGGGVQTMDSRPAGGRGRKNSTLSQSSDSGALGTSGVGRLSLQHLNGRRHSNHSQVSQRSLDSGQDSLVGGVGVVHIRSRSQPASGGTEEEDGEEDDKGSGMLSVRTGSKHTSGSDNSEAVSVPPSSTVERHGSLLSLSRRSLTTKELTDSAYSSGMSTRPLEMSIATPTRSALIRKGSGGILEARGDACADEPVIEWSALGPIGEKKQKAINSLMNTEFHFCEVLRAGIVMYLDPLRDVLLPVHHETIFHNLEELYRLSYDTSTQLKACCQPYCSSAPVPYYVESVGSIYHSKIDRLLAAVVSCQNQQTQSHNQISYCLASNKAFNALVQNAGQSLSIHSFVDAINEYLPKLARYLMGVSYFTPLWHEDHKYLTSIVKALLKVCPDKDLRDKWLMDQDMMENLKVRLGFETGVQPFTIVIPGRVLLNEGEVSLVVEKKKKKKIWLMLFSDILVLAKKQGKVLATTETPFLLEQLTVNDLNCDETEFQVQSVDGKIKRLMRAGSAQEKGEWMLMLKEWTSGTHTMPNGVPTRHTASSASRLAANSNGLLRRNGSVSVHKVPSPPKIVSSSLTQPDSGGFSPSEHYVPFSQPTDFAQNGVQPRLRSMTTTAVRSHSVAATKHTADDVDVSRRSM